MRLSARLLPICLCILAPTGCLELRAKDTRREMRSKLEAELAALLPEFHAYDLLHQTTIDYYHDYKPTGEYCVYAVSNHYFGSNAPSERLAETAAEKLRRHGWKMVDMQAAGSYKGMREKDEGVALETMPSQEMLQSYLHFFPDWPTFEEDMGRHISVIRLQVRYAWPQIDGC